MHFSASLESPLRKRPHCSTPITPATCLQERRAGRRKQRDWLREREAYGKTPSGKFVDQQPLQQLLQLGYEKGLAAEALRAADNDGQAALDVLGDPVRRGALQLALIAQQVAC